MDNKTSSENDKYSEFIVNGIPIRHCNCISKKSFNYDSFVDDVKSVWRCLENVASIFCQLHCDRNICNVEDSESLHPGEDSNQLWIAAMKDFHNSISYLPETLFSPDGCPACNVANAFTVFPILARFSPIPPISTLKRFTVEDFPLETGDGAINWKTLSLPCYKFWDEQLRPEEIQLFIRENALVKIDIDLIPNNSQLNFNNIEMIKKGKLIVKYLNMQLNNPAKSRNEWAELVNKKHSTEKLISTDSSDKHEPEVILCMQPITHPDRKHKSFFAELVINPGKGKEKINRRLGKLRLRFFYLILNAKKHGIDEVDNDTLKAEFNYHGSVDDYWFIKQIYNNKQWLKKYHLIQYFEFNESGVKTTLSKEQFSLDIPDYTKAKRETH
jgi:hypothetical protein